MAGDAYVDLKTVGGDRCYWVDSCDVVKKLMMLYSVTVLLKWRWCWWHCCHGASVGDGGVVMVSRSSSSRAPTSLNSLSRHSTISHVHRKFSSRSRRDMQHMTASAT
jgi:hypothetical protein